MAVLASRPTDLEDMPEVTDWSGAVRGKLYTSPGMAGTEDRRVPLPPAVAAIFDAIRELEQAYPGRKFTLDGHLAGSIGEVIAAEALNLELHPVGHPVHDAFDADGDVQIKITGGRSVAMYSPSQRLVVLRIVSPREAEIVYDGSGIAAWEHATKPGKSGQRVVSLRKLRAIRAAVAA